MWIYTLCNIRLSMYIVYVCFFVCILVFFFSILWRPFFPFFFHRVQYIGIEQVSAFSLIMRLSVHLSSYLQGNTNPPHLRSNITIGTQWCFIAGLLGRISLLFLFFLHIGLFFFFFFTRSLLYYLFFFSSEIFWSLCFLFPRKILLLLCNI